VGGYKIRRSILCVARVARGDGDGKQSISALETLPVVHFGVEGESRVANLIRHRLQSLKIDHSFYSFPKPRLHNVHCKKGHTKVHLPGYLSRDPIRARESQNAYCIKSEEAQASSSGASSLPVRVLLRALGLDSYMANCERGIA